MNRHLGHSEPLDQIKRPLPSEFIASKADCSKDENEVHQLSEEYRIDYPAVIGSLIYLLNTRPDLTFAVTKLAKFMKSPGRTHFKAIIHTLKYVRDNARFGLKYYHNWSNSPIFKILSDNGLLTKHELIGTHDSSWQDCPDTGRSTGCYIHFMQGGPVDFSTFVPSPIAMSSAESETNAGANAGMVMQHLRMLRNELSGMDVDLLLDPPILMLCDNNSAVIIANSEKDVKSLRHCKRRLFYMKQLRREKETSYEFIPGESMVADLGTKNLDVPILQPLINMVMTKIDDVSTN